MEIGLLLQEILGNESKWLCTKQIWDAAELIGGVPKACTFQDPSRYFSDSAKYLGLVKRGLYWDSVLATNLLTLRLQIF